MKLQIINCTEVDESIAVGINKGTSAAYIQSQWHFRKQILYNLGHRIIPLNFPDEGLSIRLKRWIFNNLKLVQREN